MYLDYLISRKRVLEHNCFVCPVKKDDPFCLKFCETRKELIKYNYLIDLEIEINNITQMGLD